MLLLLPGTPHAEEAVIASEVPQTATVYRAKATFTPVINGAPELEPVPDTSLMYVFNSPAPIIRVSEYEWYAVQSGVWFTASSVEGPWVVATSIPAAVPAAPAGIRRAAVGPGGQEEGAHAVGERG
jgi:hypothetical protein